jgi:putative nucleotidyltransferase with HDIG domain
MEKTASIIDFVRDKLASENVQIPVIQPLALRVQSILQKSDYTIEELTRVIEEEQALASQILRVANSSLFAGLAKISTIQAALIRLGAKQVANLAMLVSQKNMYHSKNKVIGNLMQTLWRHSVACAFGARWLAEKAGWKNLTQEAMLAGLLHDIGKLFLLKMLEEMNESKEQQIELSDAVISEVLESMHAEQGYNLLKQWNLPDTYCEIVRDHHKYEFNKNNTLLLIVRLVDLACRKLGIGFHHEPAIVLGAAPEAYVLGLKEITLAELEIALEDSLTLPI